jgi:hypothetical protein
LTPPKYKCDQSIDLGELVAGSAKRKGKKVTKRSGICGRKGITGVEKGDKAFLESLYYLFEGTTRNTNRQTSKRQQGPIAHK